MELLCIRCKKTIFDFDFQHESRCCVTMCNECVVIIKNPSDESSPFWICCDHYKFLHDIAKIKETNDLCDYCDKNVKVVADNDDLSPIWLCTQHYEHLIDPNNKIV